MGTTTKYGKGKDLKTVSARGLVACVYVRYTCVYLLVSGALVLVSPWLSVVYNGTEHTHTLTQSRERTMRSLRHP